MLNKILSAGAKLRFALWAVEKMIPDPIELQPYVSKGVAGLVAIISCAIFGCIGVIIGAIAIYLYAIEIALMHVPAMLIGSGLCILIALTGYLIAHTSIIKALSFGEADKLPSPPRRNSFEEAFNNTVDGFIDGLMTSPAKRRKPDPTVSHPSETEASPFIQKNAKATKPMTKKSQPEVVPIITGSASAEEILHHHPKTASTY